MSRRDNGDGNVWYDEKRDIWRARVSIDGFPKPKYPTASSRTKLNAKIKELKKEAPPSGITVRSAAEEWLRDHVHPPTCRQSTYDQYSYLMRVHILPAIGDMPVETVRPKNIQRIIANMKPVTARKTPLSPRTRRHAETAIHALYTWMVLNKMVAESPVVGIKLPEIGETTRRSLDAKEIPLFLEAMDRSRWACSVRFLLLTGLRRGELLALRWEDIIRDKDGHSWIKISRTRSRDGEEGPPKSRAGLRTMRIGKAVQAILDAQRDMLLVDGLRPWVPSPDVKDDKPKKGETAYVFPAYTGDPVQPNTYYYNVRKLAEKAGVSISIHELRHTFVSISGRGMDLKSLQSVLGHTSSTLTLDLYRHILDGDLERAADVVDSTAFTLGIVPSKDFQQTTPETTPDAEKRVPG